MHVRTTHVQFADHAWLVMWATLAFHSSIVCAQSPIQARTQADSQPTPTAIQSPPSNSPQVKTEQVKTEQIKTEQAASPSVSTAGGLELAGMTQARYSRARPGRPLTILVGVENNSDATATGVVLASIDAAPTLQSTTEVSIPAHQSRMVPMRLQLPSPMTGTQSITVNVSLRPLGAQDRIMLSRAGQPLIDSVTLPLETDVLTTAILIESEPPRYPDWAWPQEYQNIPYEWVVAARVDADLSRRTFTLSTENLPTELAQWNSLDSLVIGVDWPLHDVAALQSLRSWMSAGGRVWVMLDLVDDKLLRHLLPDGMTCEMIDDVELNELHVDVDLFGYVDATDRDVSRDEPVRLRRVLQTGGKVTHTIDGFPAAIHYRIGQGQLLVTTLAANAWITPRTRPPHKDPMRIADYQLYSWARSSAEQFFDMSENRSPIMTAEVDYPMQLIGNPVLNRRFVMTAVVGFCFALSLAAGVCWWRSKMLHLGWLVPLLSIAGALPLLAASAWQRRDMPDSSAHLQLIEVQPGSNTIEVKQWTATYSNALDNARLVAHGDAALNFSFGGDQLDLRNWTWNDWQRWQLTSSNWPRGIWQLRSQFVLPPSSLDVSATLDARGLSLTAPKGLDQPLEDAVLQFVAGDPVVCGTLKPGETRRVESGQLKLNDSWIGSNLVTDEQTRRDMVYQQVVARDSQKAYPSYPALLGWTGLQTGVMQWDGPLEQRGAALAVLPIRLEPVPSGSEVQIPHSLIRVQTFRSVNSYSTAFSNTSGQWRGENSLPATIPLRFELPSQVLPFSPKEVIAHLQLRAPRRVVRVLIDEPSRGAVAREPQTSGLADASVGRTIVHEATSQLGAIQFRITDPQLLNTLRDGRLEMHLDIGKQTSGGDGFGDSVANWQVDFFRIDVLGTVGERTLATEPGSSRP